MSTYSASAAIVKEITIEAPASDVFHALVDPAELAHWWGDEVNYRLVQVESDARVGGSWRIVGALSDGETFVVAGAYRIVEPPRLLEYTWRHESEAEVTSVRFELSEREGETHLRLVHSGFETAESREEHERGWPLVMAWLKNFAERH